MRYRRLGRTGLEVSEIGLGGHEYRRKSLVKDGRFSEPDPRRPELVRRAVEAGVTYFDTTFSEEAQSLGSAIRSAGVDRSKVRIAAMSVDLHKRMGETECSCWDALIRRELAERLELLGTDHVDVFNLCGLESWSQKDRLSGALDTLQRLRESGLVRHLGASAHDPDLLAKAIMERDPFDVIMTYLNYANQPSSAFFGVLRAKDVGFVVLKPLVWFEYGVCFTHVCRAPIESRSRRGASAARMAIRWILRYPEVSTVVPAANTLEELLDDVAASELPWEEVDLALLEACRALPDRMQELVELIDHPYEEVRSFALAAVRQRVGADHGTDKEAYRRALAVAPAPR